ncbi:hypothetical protein IAT40_001575 [Kwoniella sp. CBS 6097]
MAPRTRKTAGSGPGTSTSGAGGAGTTSRAKRAAGLSQPTLSFQSQRPSSLAGKSKSKLDSKSNTKTKLSASTTPSLSEIEVDEQQPRIQDEEVVAVPPPAIAIVDEEAEVKEIKPVAQLEQQHQRSTMVPPKQGQSQKRRQLDVKSKEWKGLVKSYKEAMGGMQPIHAGPDTHNDIHHILRVFDMTSSYGPCVGITRLQRWERAQKWGLNPPEEIRSILTTEQGEDDVRYRETVLHGWV